MKKLFLFLLLSTVLSSQVIMNPPSGGQVSNPSSNGAAYWDGTKLTTSPTGGAGTLCLVSTAGAAPVFAACSGSAATAWSSLTNPSGNVTIALGNNTTTFTASTATTAPFVFQDTTGNTSVLPLLRISTVGTSTALPIKITAQGTTVGVQMSAAGVLAPLGSGVISANQVNLAVVPTSAVIVGSNGSNQLVAATTSGSGTTVPLTVSPVFTTPTLGDAAATTVNKLTITTPATGSTLTIANGKTLTASNTLTLTGTDASSVAFGTGGTVAYTANNLGVFATTTSAQLRGVISDESGTGVALFAGGALGAATATSINKVTLTQPATGSTLTIADGKTLTASNTLTFTGTDSSSVAFGGGGTVAFVDKSNTFTTGTQDFRSVTHSLPAKTGTIGNIPATCTFGEQYFSTSATAGSNLYLCTDASNTWTAVPGSGGAGNVTGPGSSTTGHFATYGDGTGKLLVDTISLVTTVANPGLDTTVPTEKAVRAAIVANVAGVASLDTKTGAITLAAPLSTSSNVLQCPACVTSAAALTNNQLVFGGGSQATAVGDLIGDVTTAGGKTTVLGNIPTAVTMAGYLAATAIAAPATPGAGLGRIYVDSTSKNLSVKDDAGVIKHGIQTNTGTANQFATAVSDAGVVTLAQPTILNLAAFSSANLATQLTDETGSGAAVFGTSPALTTPTLGVATATTINKVTLTAPATGSTLTIADGKTLTSSNTLTFTGTDASSVAFGTGGTVAYTANNLSVFASTTSAQMRGVLSDESGTGALLFANGAIGAATMTSLNKVAITAPTTAATLAFGTDNATLTFQGTGTVVNRDSTDTLTNKTMVAPVLGAATMTSLNKVAITAPTTAATLAFPTDNATITFQGTDTYVGRATVDTLTNKSIAGSEINSGTVAYARLPADVGNQGQPITVTQSGTTATFSCTSNTLDEFYITLTAAVTTSTLTGPGGSGSCPTGAEVVFHVNVGTGPFAFTWPVTGFSGAGTPIPTANVTTTQAFDYDGTNANPKAPATANGGTGQLSEVAAPAGNPSAGNDFFWADSTAHMPQSKDNSGNLDSMVRTAGGAATCGASCTQYVDYILSTGIPHTSQVAFTSVSGRTTESQLPTTAVVTDAASTYTTGLQDFSAVTLKLPAGAGATASSSSNTIIDTTNSNLHLYNGNADVVAAVWSGAALPTNGQCPQITVTTGRIILSGVTCPSGTGTVTHTGGALTSGQLLLGNGGADIKVGDLSGVVTTSGSGVTAFNSSTGSGAVVLGTAPTIHGTKYVTCGGSDDTAALQTAANTAGTWVFAPGATCVIGDTGGAGGAGVTMATSAVKWTGNGATLKHKTGATGDMIVFSATVSLDNFIIDQNGASSSGGDNYTLVASSGQPTITNSIWRNTGATTTSGALFLFTSGGTLEDDSIESTIPGGVGQQGDIWISALPATGVVKINRTLFSGGTYNQIFIQGGSAGSEVSVTNSWFYNVGQLAGNTGQTGNSIIAYQVTGDLNILGNHFYNPLFTAVRLNQNGSGVMRAVVNGNIVEGAGEASIYAEFGTEGAVISNNTILNGSSGIVATNLSSRPNGLPNLITGNTLYNMNFKCFHVESDTLDANSCAGSPIGVELGFGSTGQANNIGTNTWTKVTIPIAPSAGLSATPNNIIGNQVYSGTGYQTATQVASPTAIVFNGGSTKLNISGISKATSAVVNYSAGTTPLVGQVYVFGNIFGMIEINGQYCTVSGSPAPTGAPGAFTCTGLNSTTYTTFNGSPAVGDADPQALLVYSSGTTPANSMPAVVLNRDATNASNITSGLVGLARGGTNVDLSGAGGAVNTTGAQVLHQDASHVISASALAAVDLPAALSSSTSINKVTITAPATSATLTVANGKTLTASNTLTLAGTDSTTMTFPTTSATIARTDAANTFTGIQTFSTPIALGSGGTNAALTAANGGLVYSGASALAITSAGTAKQVVLSGGAGAPTMIDFPDSKSIPFCVNANGTAGIGVTTTTAVACTARAGTNNKDAFLGPFTTSDTATFKVHLPKDWDSGTAPALSVDVASTDGTNGHTIILQAASGCSKLDGSTNDDVAFNTAQLMGTITLGAGGANQTWTTTLSALTTTGCSAPGILWIKITRAMTDNATNVELYQADVTIPRLLTMQAN